MITFTSRFFSIINTNECVPETTGWITACVEKTYWYIVSSLILLLIEIIWYNILKICLVAVAIGVIIIAKSRNNNNGPNNHNINEQQPRMRQRQEQHQATNVLIQTNGEEPVTITSRSTPTPIRRRETINQATTPIPTTSRGTNERRTSVSFMRRDIQEKTSSTHSSRDNSSDDSLTRYQSNKRKSKRISRKSLSEDQRKTAAEKEWCKQNSDQYRKSSRKSIEPSNQQNLEKHSMVLRDRSASSAE